VHLPERDKQWKYQKTSEPGRKGFWCIYAQMEPCSLSMHVIIISL
jgi:hypothetical protein